jgi:outer membrane protein assembly factor BamB
MSDTTFQRFVFVRWISVFVLSAALSTEVMAGDGEILFINSFEGTGNVPQFVPIADQAGVVDRLVQIDVDTSDPANQNGIVFSLVDAPSGMSIRAADGTISWTPTAQQMGPDSVTVQAEDLEGLSNTLSFNIEIVGSSASPLLEAIPDQVVSVGETFLYSVEASDPDPGDVLDFSLIAPPQGLLIDPVTGQLSWTPQIDDVASYTVRVRVSDPSGAANETLFSLQVVAANQPPLIEPLPDRGAAPGVLAEIQVIASDPDGGPLHYRLSERPTGMVIDPASGRIRWTPTLQQLGPHPVTVVVQDPLGTQAETRFDIVADLNRAPVAVDDGGFRVERGDTLTVAAPGVLANDTDPNEDPLSAQLVDPPLRGMLQLSADGGFEYTPDNPAGTIGFELDWAANVSAGGGNWTPIIANMDDDPQSEILVNLSAGCCQRELRSYDGLDGSIDWSIVFLDRELSFDSQPVVADIDLDGLPELVVIGGEPDNGVTRESMLYAFEHDGTLKWLSEEYPSRIYRNGGLTFNADFFGSALSIADLDQDGFPEIVAAPNGGPVQFTVWDHEGQLIRTVFSDEAILNDFSVRVTLVDLDLDGDLEVVVGGTAWEHDGTPLWNLSGNFANSSLNDFPIVANLDEDPYPELIRTRGSSVPDQRGDLLAINHDGTVKWEIIASTLGTSDSPLAAADLNQDGFADVIRLGPPFESYVEARDGRDGTLLWTSAVESGRGGVTVFDMNRDGFPEVIVFDPSSDLYVLNGQDGSELLFFPTVDSGVIRPPFSTAPVFADIDADGQAELVLSMGASFSNTPTVSVYQSPQQDWGPMRSIWNEYMYRVTNVNDDLTIPAREPQHWLQPGLNQATVNERLPKARTEEQDQFSYRANDGLLVSNTATVDITILPPNTAPRILSAPRRFASPGFLYRYRALAVDADPGEDLTWTIAEGPAGMTVDAQGTVSWTPTVSDLGSHPVVLEVTDTIGVSGFQNFLIEVQDPISVPDLAGLSETQALEALDLADLVADPVRDVFSDTIVAGQVVAQSPAAGILAAAGDPVQVDVSLGPQPLQVPDLIALTLVDATADILGEGFSVGAIDFVNDPLQPVNTVLIQDPAPASAGAPGSMIDLTVSGGPRAEIDITPRIIPAGQSANVSVIVRDTDGTPLDPQPAIGLSLDVVPTGLVGTPPMLSGDEITTNADSQGSFRVVATFDISGVEEIAAEAVVTQLISDGEGANVFGEFVEQLETFDQLIGQLITAVALNDAPTILTIDAALEDLLEDIDLDRLSGLTPIAPEGGVPPSPETAAQNGFPPGNDDDAYLAAALDLFATLEQAEEVVTGGTAPDRVLNVLNQELGEVASVISGLEPDVFGVLDSSEVLIALLGTRAPRMLVADIEAVRQELRDSGVITSDGTVSAGRFSLVGVMTASQIRTKIIKDVYGPYLGDVARAMGTLIAADLLQAYANGGSIVSVITGASQSFQVFKVDNSVIEGVGFDTLLPEGNSVILVGPELINSVLAIINQDLPQAQDLKDLNKIKDAIQAEITLANNLSNAIKGAVSAPDQVLRGCLFDSRPECRQLLYLGGFDSVYKTTGGGSLPAPVAIIVYNLAGGGFSVFVAPFIPTR